MTPRTRRVICNLVAAAGMIGAFTYFVRVQDKALGVLALMIAIIVARILVLDIAERGGEDGGEG